MNIKIIKGMKLPVRNASGFEKSNRGSDAIWPLAELEINDGFSANISKTNALRCSIQHHQRWYPGVKFTTKIAGDKILVKRIA